MEEKSAKTTYQRLKILYLYRIFLEKTDEQHYISMSEIISQLELYGISAGRKAIYEDIEALKTFGLDIVQLNGKGCEQRGKRPVLILQNDVGNKHSPTTIVAPITSAKKRRNLPVHVPLYSNKLNKDSMVLLEQVQVMDKSRLGKMICSISDKQLTEVEKALAVSFGMNNDFNGGNANE